MPLYSQEKIDEVNQATDLVELVSRYAALKRAGSVYKGLCPFHNEKTPSFVVTPQRHRFKCFGCGKGGGAITFLMLAEGLGFPEALAELARRAGISLPAPDPAERRDGINRAGLLQVMEKARDFYADRLWSAEGAAARRYLAEERGLGRAVAEAFGLGLAPEGNALRRHLARAGFSDQIASQAGLVKPGREAGSFFDFFKSRLMVPIADAQGRVLAFGGRALPGGDESVKYLNTGETPLYTKGLHLFGLNRARPFIRAAGLAYLVEGYFDVISLASAGINEAVAALGTALTDRQVSLLKGLTVPVYLLFDGDEAGRKAAARHLPAFLNADLEARVVSLPPKEAGQAHDPDSFVQAFGAGELNKLSQNAPEYFNYWVEDLKLRFPDSGGVQAQLRRLGEARELLGRLTDPAKRRIVRRRLAELLNIGEGDLEDGRRSSAAAPRRPAAAEAGPQAEPEAPGADPIALELLGLVLVHPETAGLVLENMSGYWPPDQSRLLFDRLRAAFAARGEAGLESIEGGDLPEPLAGLVGRTVLAPRVFPSGRAEGAARQYMGRLAAKWGRLRQAELSQGIARAQAAGDEAEARRLAGEKEKVAASLKGSGFLRSSWRFRRPGRP